MSLSLHTYLHIQLLTSFYIRVWTTINIQFLDPENFLGKIKKGLWICSVPEKSWLNRSAGLTVALHCQGQLYPSNFVNHPSSTSHYVATYVNIPSIQHSTHCTGGHWFTLDPLHSNCHLSDLHCNFSHFFHQQEILQSNWLLINTSIERSAHSFSYQIV